MAMSDSARHSTTASQRQAEARLLLGRGSIQMSAKAR